MGAHRRTQGGHPSAPQAAGRCGAAHNRTRRGPPAASKRRQGDVGRRRAPRRWRQGPQYMIRYAGALLDGRRTRRFRTCCSCRRIPPTLRTSWRSRRKGRGATSEPSTEGVRHRRVSPRCHLHRETSRWRGCALASAALAAAGTGAGRTQSSVTRSPLRTISLPSIGACAQEAPARCRPRPTGGGGRMPPGSPPS